MFGSNNINYIDEQEIINAKYINENIYTTIINNQINSSINNNSHIITHSKTFTNEKSYKYYRFKILSNIDYYPYLKPVDNSNTNNNYLIQMQNIPNNYLFNFNNNSYNIENKFDLNISGISVGNYEIVDYSKLYIEDINYITDANITSDYIELTLKYNLLNSRLKGENVIISNNKITENLFATQNLIIYDKWYTRIFYQGYNSIYNNSHISKTEGTYICDFNNLIITNEIFNVYSNSNYTFKSFNKLRFYEIKLDINTIISINEINYNTYNIDFSNSNYKTYENYTYSYFKTNNINYKYLDLNFLNINKVDFKIILLSENNYFSIYNNLGNCELNNNNIIITLVNNTITINYLDINFKKNNNKRRFTCNSRLFD